MIRSKCKNSSGYRGRLTSVGFSALSVLVLLGGCTGGDLVNIGIPAGTASTITADPTVLRADGVSTSSVLVQLKDADLNNLTQGGDVVSLTTSLGTLSPIKDNQNGTYSSTLTSGTSLGTAVIAGSVNGELIKSTASVTIVPSS